MKRGTASPRALANERGQSITETVIFLPVLLLLFLGITYLKELTDARSRAVEAARYVTWEGVWHTRALVRNGTGGGVKDAATLTSELRTIGLGRNLRSVQATMGSSLGDFVNQFDKGPSGFSPQFLPPLNIKLQFVGVLGSLPSELSSLVSLAGTPAYALQDFIARQSKWVGESRDTVYTATVKYGFKGGGLFARMPGIEITQTASLVSSPYLLERDDPRPQGGESAEDAERRANQAEFDDMFGKGGVFDCNETAGHVFDLWLFPTGPLGNDSVSGALSSGLSTVKCVIAGIGKIVDFIPFANLDFKQPDGTLKQFSEQAIKP